ncbi:DUF3800 domain-containing protein [Phytoactinopolyspora halotolerans]|uniref:DUF3800 domain-containing protein n=1 Tax=Phytoactinopolyspora halotolerans TaxID=1981512 RepID=A0A6L9S3F0_9ACTN|nr:DUF3800 domain-containing protein [Phytoactinopolyspora halotolerans]NED99944.1 DUF3800 domain-containing protein [Phytoactinopolyspora halotolerans]
MPNVAPTTSNRLSASIDYQPFVAPPETHKLPLLRAYIDETGDRGILKGRASPIFGMAAVMVDDDAERSARQALGRLRTDFNVPSDRPLSWKDDLKNHDRRVHAANILSTLKGLRVVYVVADKSQLSDGTYRDDVTLFYNVIAYAGLQRVLWAARAWPDGKRQVKVHFSHVKKHDHTDTHRYFQIKKRQDKNVPFDLVSKLSWVSSDKYEMSQIADVYAGFLKAAFWPNVWQNTEGAYLLKIWHQIRRSEECVISLGMQVRPNSKLAFTQPWWPCPDCKSPY